LKKKKRVEDELWSIKASKGAKGPESTSFCNTESHPFRRESKESLEDLTKDDEEKEKTYLVPSKCWDRRGEER